MNTQPIEHEAVGAIATQANIASAASQLITLDPAKYVAEVFKPFNDMFAILKAEADTITPDASTAAGMEICVKYRAAFRDDVRVAGEKARVERKAPILTIGKLLDSKYADLKNAVIPYEAKFDAPIKVEEKRKDDLKRAEAEREEKTRMRIVAIRDLPVDAIGKTAAGVAEMIVALEADMPDETFGKLQDAAVTARAEVLVKLAAVHAGAVASESEAARIAAERAELAQLREAAAERQRMAQVEADRVAAEQRAEAVRLAALAAEQEASALREREAAAAKLKQEADAQAEKNRKEQAEIARQRQELIDMQAAAAKAKADAEEAERQRQDAAALAERARQDAIDAADQSIAAAANVAADATAVEADGRAAALLEQGRLADIADAQSSSDATQVINTENPLAGGQLGRPLDEQMQRCAAAVAWSEAKAAAAPTPPPTLRLGHINERIAPLAISADGLLSLGFAPAATDKAAKLYHEVDFPRICAAMQRHIDAVRVAHAA